MSRVSILTLSLFAVGWSCGGSEYDVGGTADAPQAATRSQRPNIIFFLADDMGWGDPGSYNADSKIPTPHLDTLAEQGMRFTDAHTTATVCMPSRYSAMTGNYHWRGLLPFGQSNYRGGSQILNGQWTVADILQRNGYETAFFGKYNLGGRIYEKGSSAFAGPSEREGNLDFARGSQLSLRWMD